MTKCAHCDGATSDEVRTILREELAWVVYQQQVIMWMLRGQDLKR